MRSDEERRYGSKDNKKFKNLVRSLNGLRTTYLRGGMSDEGNLADRVSEILYNLITYLFIGTTR